MSLEALASTLKKHGIGCSIVTAAEAKDTGAPYSRKRFLKSLDDTRLTYVGVALAQLSTLIDSLERFGSKEAADMSTAELKKQVVALLDKLQTIGEVFEKVDGVGLKSVTAYSGAIDRAYRRILKLASAGWSGNVDAWYEAINTLLIWQGVITKDYIKVMKQAKSRSSTLLAKIQKLAQIGKLSTTKYTTSIR